MAPSSLNAAALNEISRVFAPRTEGASHFSTPAIEHIRQSLRSSLSMDSDNVLVLVGAAGVGKTLLLQSLLRYSPAFSSARKAHLSFTLMDEAEILRSMAYAFGMSRGETQEPIDWLEDRLRSWAADGQRSLLVVDEAQGLSLDALRALLGLSQMRSQGRTVLRVVLAGQPELLGFLGMPEVAPFTLTLFTLQGFRPAESAAYVRDRMARYDGPPLPSLSDTALTEIHLRTEGLPGRINNLCVRLMHTASLRGSLETISAAMVAAEASELAFYPAARPFSPAPRDTQQEIVTEPVVSHRLRWPVGLIAGALTSLLVCGALLHVTLPSRRGTLGATPAQTAPASRQSVASIETPRAAGLAVHSAVNRTPITAAITERHISRVAAPGPVQGDTTYKLCEKLLVQVSLGEPLSDAQQQALETQCHGTRG